jgi:hypothetical protein
VKYDCDETDPLAKYGDQRSAKKENIRRDKTCEIGQFQDASLIDRVDD